MVKARRAELVAAAWWHRTCRLPPLIVKSKLPSLCIYSSLFVCSALWLWMYVGPGTPAENKKKTKKSSASPYRTFHVVFTGYPSFGLNFDTSSLVCWVQALRPSFLPPHLSLSEEFATVFRWDPFVATRLGMVIFVDAKVCCGDVSPPVNSQRGLPSH